jgi:hypothetical protein
MLYNIDLYSVVELSQTQPTMAWLWLLGLIPALMSAGIVGTAFYDSIFSVDGKSLGVLGLKGAGKTQLYRTLQRKEYTSYQGTATDDYDEFSFKYGNKTIRVKKGRDIGGGENYILEYYAKFINEKDIIFFVFDAHRYINDKSYSDQVKARMEFVWRKMLDKYGYNEIKTKLATIGSHYDQFNESERNNLLGKFQDDVSGKSYSTMFHRNFILADITNYDKFMDELIKSKIFG